MLFGLSETALHKHFKIFMDIWTITNNSKSKVVAVEIRFLWKI